MRCCATATSEEGICAIPTKGMIGQGSSVKVLKGEGLELVQVQVIFRHGSRTPLNFVSGLPEATYDRQYGIDLMETNIPHQVVTFLDGRAAGPSLMEQDYRDIRLKGGCRPSILTTVGQKEMLNLGRKIREVYMDALKIETFNLDRVRIRSSHIERTVKSLKCVMVGLYGKITLNKMGVLKIPVKDIWDEDIFPNKLSCPSLRLAVSMTLANLDSIPDYSTDKRLVLRALGLPTFAHLDFSCVKDDTSARVAHGNPYPKVIEPYRDKIEVQAARVLRAVTTGRIEGNPPRDDILMMSIGRLMHTILTDFEDTVCGAVKPRLYLYSGHDTTLAPLLEVLGLPQQTWPPFSASVAIELYRSRDPQGGTEFFIRVLYCWKEQLLPYHTEMLVPFPAFRRMTSRYTLTPGEFRRMCNNTPAGVRV